MMSTISLKQRKEFEGMDLVLETKRGVKYWDKSKGTLNEYVKFYGPMNYNGAYSISNELGYLSYKRFMPPYVRTVKEWQDLIAAHKTVLPQSCITGRIAQRFITDSEIRFYPDCKYIILFQGKKDVILQYITLDNISKEDIDEDVVTITPVDWTRTYFGSATHQSHFIYLKSEADITDHLQTLAATKASAFANTFFSKADSDLLHGRIQNTNAYDNIAWSYLTSNRVDDCLQIFTRKYKDNYATKKLGNYNRNAFYIPFFISAPDAPAAAALNKTEKAEMLIAPVQREWEHGDSKTMYWYRYNDYVCVIAPGTQSRSSYGYDNCEKKLVAYNVKTKKRLYAVKSKASEDWSFPIPSSKYISEAMPTVLDPNNKDSSSYSYSSSKRGATSSVIKGGLSVRELFEGTNVAWFLDYAEDDKVYYQNTALYSYAREDCKYNLIPTKQLFRKDYIDTLAILMLCTTGTPLLEQFLKSKLFNLYFVGIQDLMNDGSTFVSKTKKDKRTWNYGNSLVYDEKGKNLKQMFGLSMNFLRLLDKAKEVKKIERKKNNCGTDSGTTEIIYDRDYLLLGDLKETLGETINSLDQNTLEMILSIAKPGENYRYTNLWSYAKQLFDVLPDCNIKQKLLWLQKYAPSINIFADYLRMREHVKTIQETSTEISGIFSEKMYPIKIGAAKKFIPYTESEQRKCEQAERSRYYSSYSLKEVYAARHPQVNYYNSKYFVEYNSPELSPNVVECFDEAGNHSGVLLILDPAKHLNYLHDQLSFWFNFYRDSTKNKLFQQAVKRVKDLEWVDKTSGLEIVAPAGVEDLQREGTELSHCVSSFVQPIIDGTTNVVFIRRSDMKDVPYYTVEVSGGKIRQVHCYRNGGLDAEAQRSAFINSGSPVYNKNFDIISFLKRWARHSEGRVSEDSIKGTYGIMCAAR